MHVSLRDLIDTPGKSLALEVPFERDAVTFQGGQYPVLKKSMVAVKVENLGKKELSLGGTAFLVLGIPCDRCLVQTPVTFALQFDRRLNMEPGAELDEEDASCLEGTDLNVDELVCLELLMNWPFKTLCKEDCAGLCSKCGKNLNDGPCSCREEPKDPRMAAIRDVWSTCQK